MSVLRSLLEGREERAISSAQFPLGEWAGDNYQSSWSGAKVSNTSALQLATVWGCVKFICDGISTLPVDVLREQDGSPLEVTKPRWLQYPLAELSMSSWITQMVTSLLISGNAYAEIIRADGAIVGLRPVDPEQVTVRREGGMKRFYVGSKQYTWHDMMHIPGPMWPGSDVGMSPLEAARQTIGTGLAAEEFAARFFGQGLSMSGVIEVPGQLQPDQAKNMANSFARRHSGKAKAHLPGVLEGGAQWKPTSVTAEQAQFLETRKFNDSVIAGRIFLVDPTELGIPLDGTTLTYQNALDRTVRKVEVTFLPWIVRLENALSERLPQPRYVKFNVDALKRGDIATRYASYKIADDIGLLTADEMRKLEDLPPLPTKAEPPPTLAEQFDAVGALIRAGFDPEASLAALGLPSIKHTGLTPITVAATNAPTQQVGTGA